MTVVEFFDGVSICNMITCLATKPQKVIFIGDKSPMKKQEEVYKRFIEKHCLSVEFEFRSIDRNRIEGIISVLTDIVETEQDCIFDLTGGEDLVLVAMGIVYQAYKDKKKIQMHRINVNTRSVADCDRDGVIPVSDIPSLTVEDNITLYGGKIISSLEDEDGTYDWNLNGDFQKDLSSMWDICKENPGAWNLMLKIIGEVVERDKDSSTKLEAKANLKQIEKDFTENASKFVWSDTIMRRLMLSGIIKACAKEENGNVTIRFKNEQIKRCLTKAGTLLELMVFWFSQQATDKKGNSIYNDAKTGVFIDWDATIHEDDDEKKDTENEIDIILMKGLVPVFISCKNGFYNENELYKLNTVASRFGGPYARKVLVSTYYGQSNADSRGYFAQRAEDMGIELIEGVHELSEEEFKRKIRNIKC